MSVAGAAPPPTEVDASQLATVGLALLLGGLALAPVAARVAALVFPGRSVFFARWGFTHLARLVMVFVGAQLLVAWAWPLPARPGAAGILARGALSFAPAAVLAAAVARRVSPEGLGALGLGRGRDARAVAAGLACYALLLPGVVGAGFLWPWVVERLGGDWQLQAVMAPFLRARGADLLAGFVLAVVVQPFLEELLFRGFLQPLLVQNLHDRPGVVATSVVFAGLHGAHAFLPVFLLSLLLGGVMLRTRRLSAVWAVHAAHNALMLSLVLWWPTWRELLAGPDLLP